MDGDTTIAPAKKQYDEFQRAAIEAPTPALIVAGPGSGKTSTLIGRAEYLINTLNVQPVHILALTFSRKAAQEMQERLAQLFSAPGRTNDFRQLKRKLVLETKGVPSIAEASALVGAGRNGRLLGTPYYLGVIWNSLRLGLLTTLIAFRPAVT